jgi:hypothetical protein
VEVALTRGLPEAIGPLIDPDRRPGEPAAADTAVFYSIGNRQPGLRGVSFGSLLVKPRARPSAPPRDASTRPGRRPARRIDLRRNGSFDISLNRW